MTAIKERYDKIYLSPHLDDVVLSCGGQIFLHTAGGEDVLVVTLAAGEPQSEVRSVFAEFLHHNWGLDAEEVIRVRREEDAAALQSLGADLLHWSLPDCIYRVHPESGEPLYASEEAIFGAIDPAESDLRDALAEQMKALPPADQIIVPLGAGHHVDHQLTRAAAERAFDNLLYYEDYPYVQRDAGAVAQLTTPSAAWQPVHISLPEEAVAARLQAVLRYDSQIKMLFNSREALGRLLQAYMTQIGGERLWRRVSTQIDKEESALG